MDKRLKTMKPVTVKRELGLIHHLIETATREWDLPIASNPVKRVRQPALNNRRERRLEVGELELLLRALSKNRNPYIRPIVLLAIETALRRQEVLDLTWQALVLGKRMAHILVTKTGTIEIDEPFNRPKQMILRNMVLDAEAIKQRLLHHRPLADHQHICQLEKSLNH